MTPNDVARLRDITGAGVMDCKKALDDAGGDFEKAKSLIFERGIVKAERKSERRTGSGLIETYIHNNRIGVLLEVRCETDFVARNSDFRAFVRDIAMQIASMNPNDIDELLSQPFVREDSITIGELLSRLIAKIGENIKVEKFCRYEL